MQRAVSVVCLALSLIGRSQQKQYIMFYNTVILVYCPTNSGTDERRLGIMGHASFGGLLTLSADQQNQIEQWLAAMGTPQQVALRCRIVLAATRGESETAIASELEVNRKTVRLWRERFSKEGLGSLWEIAPGRGRKATYGPERVKAVLDATLQSKPKGHTHWSCRLMAASQGMGKSTVSNLWKSHNIKPHRTRTFKLSRDPRFLEKLTDVVGLYLNPPDKA
jgi:transposase